jgi:hypothetical protein
LLTKRVSACKHNGTESARKDGTLVLSTPSRKQGGRRSTGRVRQRRTLRVSHFPAAPSRSNWKVRCLTHCASRPDSG